MFVAWVYPRHVLLHISFRAETHRANRALEGSLAGVNAEVDEEVGSAAV